MIKYVCIRLMVLFGGISGVAKAQGPDFTRHISLFMNVDSIAIWCESDTIQKVVKITVMNYSKSILLFDSSAFDILPSATKNRVFIHNRKPEYDKIQSNAFRSVVRPTESFSVMLDSDVKPAELSCNILLFYLGNPTQIVDVHTKGFYYNVVDIRSMYMDNFVD